MFTDDGDNCFVVTLVKLDKLFVVVVVVLTDNAAIFACDKVAVVGVVAVGLLVRAALNEIGDILLFTTTDAGSDGVCAAVVDIVVKTELFSSDGIFGLVLTFGLLLATIGVTTAVGGVV
jgi:hypothetical protein